MTSVGFFPVQTKMLQDEVYDGHELTCSYVITVSIGTANAHILDKAY